MEEGIPLPVLPEGATPLEYEKSGNFRFLDVIAAGCGGRRAQLAVEVWYGVYVMNQKVGAMSFCLGSCENGKTLVQKQTFRME